eukprot:TRINITY_DN16569_c0_g1_i1.p1 TRINITY_DN16569_c0_g1~~TRINITY_DN16569_c0_g1_i1.p1  ORF type:complete len:447 (+),score=71.08 TRINITY_DN16569_c0_g1_i1:25-1365(+)
MARPFVLLRSLLAGCLLRATFSQDNPFSDFDSFTAPPAPPRPPPLPAQEDSSRRLGAIADFGLTIVDVNETAAYAGEEIAGFDISMTVPSDDTSTIVVRLPSGLFTGPIIFLSSDITETRRLQADFGDMDPYGRRLGTCRITAAEVKACSATSVGGSGMCLVLSLADAAGNACNVGARVSAQLRSNNLAAVTTAATAGNFNMDVSTFDSNHTALDSQSFVLAVLNAAGLAVSDPITIYHGQKTKFWLPYWGKHLLVQTPDLAVSASVLQGPRKDLQWFDRFYIKLPDGRQVVEVGVKREVPRNSTWRSRQLLLSQLDIKLGGSQESLRERKNHAFESPDGQVKVAIGFRRHDTPRLRGDPITEYVNVETKSITFLLVASHAGNEFPDDVEMQNKYVHLDWITREMIGTQSFTGILPQIWGVQKPMSEEVASMLRSPAESAAICAEA